MGTDGSGWERIERMRRRWERMGADESGWERMRRGGAMIKGNDKGQSRDDVGTMRGNDGTMGGGNDLEKSIDESLKRPNGFVCRLYFRVVNKY